jgi:two-component system, chemotaxis family, response regulator Rcp1
MKNRPIEILMADDSPSDQAMTQEAIRQSKLFNKLHVVDDGEQAIQFLRKEGKFSGAPTPDLILLDLNMPRKTGYEVLAEIKKDPRWQHIPVVILTSSSAELDVMNSYKLQANCYVVKPIDFDRFSEVVHSIEDFWFSTVKLPGKIS